MNKARFLISALAAAGFGATNPMQDAMAKATAPKLDGVDDPNAGKLFRTFTQDHLVTLAQHRSHRSHRSHSSHRSSSGGGSYRTPVYTPPVYKPAPVYNPPATQRGSSPAPSSTSPSEGASFPVTSPERASPSPEKTPPLSGRSELFTSIVRRVQLGLMAYGYYEGTIDGTVGPKMKSALQRFQTDFNLKVTGTITPQVLDALKISSQ
jgi:His-Xaa-Ser repeat protein HxsA